MKPLLVSSGEPAGIGPDICLALKDIDIPLVVIGDQRVLKSRADELNQSVVIHTYQKNKPIEPQPGHLTVLPLSCYDQVIAGQLNSRNAIYVLDMLSQAVGRCLDGEFSALVTAPVHKAIINEVGIKFTGHTEFLAEACGKDTVVMMLACKDLKVALVTTHLPLKLVPEAINTARVTHTIEELYLSLQTDFNISSPYIKVAGLNPHAGESGYLGREEIDIISPALSSLRAKGMSIEGPLSADTMFVTKKNQDCDAYVVMYHDQGLPVIKYAGFGQTVNVTLGLPIIRTSVDHGTAIDIAGSGKADSSSLIAAVQMAAEMVVHREMNNDRS